MINAGSITNVDDRFGDFVSKHVAVFSIARFAAFQAVAQKSAFHQDGWINCVKQDAKVGHMHATIYGMRDGQQIRLNPIGQLDTSCGEL